MSSTTTNRHFLKVSDVLKKSVDNTLALLRQELEIHKGELQESLHFASLEKIFIEERIYKDKEFEQSKDMDAACEHIDNRLTPFYPQFIREVTKRRYTETDGDQDGTHLEIQHQTKRKKSLPK